MRVRWPVIAGIAGLALTAGAAGALSTVGSSDANGRASQPPSATVPAATPSVAAAELPATEPPPAGRPVTVKPGHGELDPAFGRHGEMGVPSANDLAVDPDGRIWAIGTGFEPPISEVKYTRRFTADGRSDPAFTADPNDPGWESLVAGEVIPLPSGGAVASWYACCGGSEPYGWAFLQEVGAAGEPARFGGSVPPDSSRALAPDWNSRANPAPSDIFYGGSVRLPDGRLRVCLSESGSMSGELPSRAVLWGLLPDGRPDPAVGPRGLHVLAQLESCGAGSRGLFTDGAGRLYAIGTSSSQSSAAGRDAGRTAVARIDVNGVPDASFGDGGVFRLTGIHPAGLLVDAEVSQKGTVFLGLTPAGKPGSIAQAAVVKVSSTGVLDRAFGSGGVLRLARSGQHVRLDSVGLLQGDRLILALTDQTARRQSGRLMAISRTSGQLDRRFGTGGVVASDLLVMDTAQQGSHGLILAGPVLPHDPKVSMRRAKGVIQRRKV